MRPVRHLGFLIALSLAITLVFAPVVADAAPRIQEDDASIPALARVWDWISNLWGAGGGGFDPTNNPIVEEPPEPAQAPSTSSPDGSGAQALRGLRDAERPLVR